MLTFAIGASYFESCCVEEHDPARTHALRRNRWTGVFWTSSQNALSFSIFLIGPLTALVLECFVDDQEDDAHHRRLGVPSGVREHALLLSRVMFCIHIMLISLSRSHEMFASPPVGLSPWRLDARPWYVVVEVAFACTHLAVGYKPYLPSEVSYEAWSAFTHAAILTCPRLVVWLQELVYVAGNTGSMLKRKVKTTVKKTVCVVVKELFMSVDVLTFLKAIATATATKKTPLVFAAVIAPLTRTWI